MKTLSKKAIQQDNERLQRMLENIHPNPYKDISQKEFRTLLENETKNVKDIRDYSLGIMVALARLNDAHTYLKLSYEVVGKESFMFKFRFIGDGYYLMKSSDTLSDYLGSKLTAINNHSITEIEKAISPLIAKENETSVRHYLPSMLMEPIILDFTNLRTNKNIILQLENKGKKESVEIAPEDYQNKMISLFEKIPNIPETLIVKDIYWFKELHNLNAFYFQYNDCEERKDLTIREVIKHFKDSNLTNLIIDLRNNRGGDSDILNPFIKFLERHNGKYKVIVLTGADTYSSATINLLELSSLPNTISVGGIPHGNPTHYGEGASFILPNSGLKIHSSSRTFWFEDYELGETFKPTYIVNTKIEGLMNGKDAQMEYLSKLL